MKTTMYRIGGGRGQICGTKLSPYVNATMFALLNIRVRDDRISNRIHNDISIVSIIIIISMIEMLGSNDLHVIPVAFQSETESLIYHVGLCYVNRYPGSANRPSPLLTLSIY